MVTSFGKVVVSALKYPCNHDLSSRRDEKTHAKRVGTWKKGWKKRGKFGKAL
jgi:hypothetical protein